MKKGITIILLFTFSVVLAQKEWTHKDKANKFSITYPARWKSSNLNKKSYAKFAAYYIKEGSPKASVILSIKEAQNMVIDSAFYKTLVTVHNRKDKFLESGEVVLNNQKFYWFSSSHETDIESSISMWYVAVKDEKSFVLKFIAYHSKDFPKYKEEFLRIANSLVLL